MSGRALRRPSIQKKARAEDAFFALWTTGWKEETGRLRINAGRDEKTLPETYSHPHRRSGCSPAEPYPPHGQGEVYRYDDGSDSGEANLHFAPDFFSSWMFLIYTAQQRFNFIRPDFASSLLFGFQENWVIHKTKREIPSRSIVYIYKHRGSFCNNYFIHINA